ncbi:hypothetical protein A2690_01105 [Candidatus Roizmanbacteria bacterium RIFCSPHIGHO2_01_FULL_39_12b]|uniref:Thymidylate synthase n=1 Tax=Candidatus Roizmanbacteria bacterium RIFCSPHIGHO2_01_FULL_39_12b TaxID=1802030 RepID=A0A1F7GA21_9BACT|nr:MAG: hypothetical protein A2690_01105 [Candidatus Roizmanbacteria bacterium RIFCSPHIGHO2_01_FULL_39_12b]
MAFKNERRIVNSDVLPIHADLEKFAPVYSPETFTDDELRYLRPFFSNTDRSVFVVTGLPEEVIGALSSRYSRAPSGMRRVFLREYILPIAKPEEQNDWNDLDEGEQRERLHTKLELETFLAYHEKHGGIEGLVNTERGRRFFTKWLAEFGDDSIAELSNAHVCLEGVSNVVANRLESQRIGISPLEKSTRYVSFRDRRPTDGTYQYVVPGELKGTVYEAWFTAMMDQLFDLYDRMHEGYLDYTKTLYPKGDNETDISFKRSRSAKRFDDIRDLLPFATQTNIAFNGNARSYEHMINRLMGSDLGEDRWWGQQIAQELERVMPSLVERPQNERGARVQLYMRNLVELRRRLTERYMRPKDASEVDQNQRTWSKLVDCTPDSDIAVIASFLQQGDHNLDIDELIEQVRAISKAERAEILRQILAERQPEGNEPKRETDRFLKPPRAFEAVVLKFAVRGRGGDYRDLHRHRQLTQDRHVLTTAFGYDLEADVLSSPFIEDIEETLETVCELRDEIAREISPKVAEYCVPFAFIQNWYIQITARELYWIVELRTGPQGRRHYREIVAHLADQAIREAPSVFQGMIVDRNVYGLARRESELRADKRRQKT